MAFDGLPVNYRFFYQNDIYCSVTPFYLQSLTSSAVVLVNSKTVANELISLGELDAKFEEGDVIVSYFVLAMLAKAKVVAVDSSGGIRVVFLDAQSAYPDKGRAAFIDRKAQQWFTHDIHSNDELQQLINQEKKRSSLVPGTQTTMSLLALRKQVMRRTKGCAPIHWQVVTGNSHYRSEDELGEHLLKLRRAEHQPGTRFQFLIQSFMHWLALDLQITTEGFRAFLVDSTPDSTLNKHWSQKIVRSLGGAVELYILSESRYDNKREIPQNAGLGCRVFAFNYASTLSSINADELYQALALCCYREHVLQNYYSISIQSIRAAQYDEVRVLAPLLRSVQSLQVLERWPNWLSETPVGKEKLSLQDYVESRCVEAKGKRRSQVAALKSSAYAERLSELGGQLNKRDIGRVKTLRTSFSLVGSAKLLAIYDDAGRWSAFASQIQRALVLLEESSLFQEWPTALDKLGEISDSLVNEALDELHQELAIRDLLHQVYQLKVDINLFNSSLNEIELALLCDLIDLGEWGAQDQYGVILRGAWGLLVEHSLEELLAFSKLLIGNRPEPCFCVGFFSPEPSDPHVRLLKQVTAMSDLTEQFELHNEQAWKYKLTECLLAYRAELKEGSRRWLDGQVSELGRGVPRQQV